VKLPTPHSQTPLQAFVGSEPWHNCAAAATQRSVDPRAGCRSEPGKARPQTAMRSIRAHRWRAPLLNATAATCDFAVGPVLASDGGTWTFCGLLRTGQGPHRRGAGRAGIRARASFLSYKGGKEITPPGSARDVRLHGSQARGSRVWTPGRHWSPSGAAIARPTESLKARPKIAMSIRCCRWSRVRGGVRGWRRESPHATPTTTFPLAWPCSR
jgi:hypothetical protein